MNIILKITRSHNIYKKNKCLLMAIDVCINEFPQHHND